MFKSAEFYYYFSLIIPSETMIIENITVIIEGHNASSLVDVVNQQLGFINDMAQIGEVMIQTSGAMGGVANASVTSTRNNS